MHIMTINYKNIYDTKGLQVKSAYEPRYIGTASKLFYHDECLVFISQNEITIRILSGVTDLSFFLDQFEFEEDMLSSMEEYKRLTFAQFYDSINLRSQLSSLLLMHNKKNKKQ